MQIDVYAPPATAEAWSGALIAQWAFGFPLNLPDVELETQPLEDVDLPLIVGTIDGVEPPTIAETGSCDGLPDDPPRSGQGSSATFAQPSEALEAFVTGADQDPAFPVVGYTEFVTSADSRSYVLDPADPVVVVEVEKVADEWRVMGWTAAAC